MWISDLHKGNVAFEIKNFDGESEPKAMFSLGVHQFVPVIARDNLHQTDSLPKYLVFPGDLLKRVNQDDLRVKIIDFGEGSSRWSPQPHRGCQTLIRSRSFLQSRDTSKPAQPIASSGARVNLQRSLDATQG